MSALKTKAEPGVAAPEPRCIAQQASAIPGYSQTGQDGNTIRPGAERTRRAPAARQCQSALECPIGAFEGRVRADPAASAFRDSVGRKWRDRGKRAGVANHIFDCLILNQRKSNGGGNGG